MHYSVTVKRYGVKPYRCGVNTDTADRAVQLALRMEPLVDARLLWITVKPTRP